MTGTICRQCRLALLRRAAPGSKHSANSRRLLSATAAKRTTSPADKTNEANSIASLLATPSWSVRSLLPSSTQNSPDQGDHDAAGITPRTLRHLLRLSALPAPRSADAEARMLSTLSSQLHFVRAIQRVDTSGIEPLYAIRDETESGRRDQMVDLASLKYALDQEDVIGHSRRPRRRRGPNHSQDSSAGHTDQHFNKAIEPGAPASGVEHWDVLGSASETTGRYFVVRSGSSSHGD